MKRILSLFTAFVMAFSIIPSLPAKAFSPYAVKDLWSIGWTVDGENIGYASFYSDVSVDYKTYYGDSKCSIKVTDREYQARDCTISKTVKVEPLTKYKFSAMVKCSDIESTPTRKRRASNSSVIEEIHFKGAYITQECIINYNFENRASTDPLISTEWVKHELFFTTTAAQNDVTLELNVGDGSDVSYNGTIWFSDVKLEKAEVTNDWNILAVTYKDIDVDVNLHDKTTSLQPDGEELTNYKNSFTDEEITVFQNAVLNLKSSLRAMSGGLVNVKDVDFVTAQKPVNEVDSFFRWDYRCDPNDLKGYRMYPKSECFTSVIDEQFEKKHYNAIIILTPMSDISGGWDGTYGSYKDALLVEISDTESLNNREFPEALIVHQLLHQLEASIKAPGDRNCTSLHIRSRYGYSDDAMGDYKWYSDYMRAMLPDNLGINPCAYMMPDGRYTLVNGDMTTAGDIIQDITKCSVEKIDDYIYRGKKITPDLTITDRGYTLKKGIDYTVKYKNNKNVGKVKITITGKGRYAGTLIAYFNIVADKPSEKL